MDDFLPSEVARLVLGYLKEVNCIKSWETFLGENPSLHEYYYLYNNGKVYCTNVDEKSLLEILSFYRSLKKYGDKIVNEIKRCEKEYNSNPDTRQDIINEITNVVSLTFQKYFSFNIGNIISVPTSDMTTAVFSEAQGNVFDNPASKSTVVDNLTVYTSQSNNAETSTFSEASENTDSTYEMPHITEVYSLSNMNNDSLSFNIATIESVKSSSEKLHIDLTKDKYLEKVRISNTEVGISNIKDCYSHMDNESQAYCVMSKDLSAHTNESVNDNVLKKCDNDLISASSPNVEAKDTFSVEMSQADILENNKLAEPVLSNSCNIKSSRDIKSDLNSFNHLIQNLENNEGLPNSPSNNFLSRPNADICGNNDLELGHDLSLNNQSIDKEVSNFEKKLDSSTDGRNFVAVTNSYQFSTISTVPTYILAGNVLMPNTSPYNYVISTPFSGMSLPLSSISYNTQNTNLATTDMSTSEKNMLAPPNLISESMLTLPDGMTVTKKSSEKNTLNTQNSILENISTLSDGQLENKSNSIDEKGCKNKDESSFKKSNIKTYEGRKRKTTECKSAALDKHPSSKCASKKKLVENSMFPSCISEQNKETQIEATPTVSEPEVSALELLSLITGQKEYYDGPDPSTENEAKNESQIMSVENANVIDVPEENVTELCSAKEILRMSDALKNYDKLNKPQKQLEFVSKDVVFQQNEPSSSRQIDKLDIKDQNGNSESKSQESYKIEHKSHENDSSSNNDIYTDCKLQNMPYVILTQLDEFEIQKNELLNSLVHEEDTKNLTKNSIVKLQKNIKLKPKSCENESSSNHLIHDIKDQNSTRKVKSQKTNKSEDEYHENESFSSHQSCDIKDQNSIRKVKSQATNKSEDECHENESFSNHQPHNIKDQNSIRKVKLQKTNKAEGGYHENDSFSSHQTHEVHIKNQNNSSKVKSQENNKSKCKPQENKSFSSYEADIKDKNNNSKVKSQKTNKLKDEYHENVSFSSQQTHDMHIKNQNSNSKVKSQKKIKSKCKPQENKSFSSNEIDIKDKNSNSRVKSQKTNKLKSVSFSSYQTHVHIKNQKNNSIVKSQENDKLKHKFNENDSFSSPKVAIKDQNSNKKVKSQKTDKLKNESFSSHQINEVHTKNQNSNSKVKLQENNKLKHKSHEKESFSSLKVDIKDQSSNNKVETQKTDKLKNESFSSHQTYEVHNKNQNNNSKVKLQENNKLKHKSYENKSFSSLKIDTKDQNSNNKVQSQKTNKLQNESFSSCQTYGMHIKNLSSGGKAKPQENNKLKHKLHENEFFNSHEIHIKSQNSNSEVKSKKSEKLKDESHKNEIISSNQTSEVLIKDQNINNNVKSQKSNKQNHESYNNESFSSHQTHEIDASDPIINSRVKSERNKKMKLELHENESFSSHQISEIDIKDQNGDSKVKSQENIEIQIYDKDKKLLKKTKAVENCREMNNLKKLNKKKSEDQSILPGASEELAEDKNYPSQKKKNKITKAESYQKSIKCQKDESTSSLNSNRTLRSKTSCKLYEIESHKNIKCQKSKNGPNCNRLLLPKISLEKITIHSMEQNVKNSSSKKISSMDQNKSFMHNEDSYLKATNKYEKLKYFRKLRNSNIVQEKSDCEQYSCDMSLDSNSISSFEDQYPKTLNYTKKDCNLNKTENAELLSHSSFESPSINKESTRSATLVISTNLILQDVSDSSGSSNEFSSEVFPSFTQTDNLVFQTKPAAQNLVQNSLMLNCNGNDSLSNKFNSRVFPSMTQTENLVVQTKPAVQNLVQNSLMLNCNGNDSLSNKFNSRVFPSMTQTENLVVQTKPAVQNLKQNTQMLNCNEDSNKHGNLSPAVNTGEKNNAFLITDARKVLNCSSQKDFINNKEKAKKIKLTKSNRAKKIDDKFPSRRLIIKKSISSYSEIVINSRDICKSIKALSLHDVSKKFSISSSNLCTEIPEISSVSKNNSNDVNEAGLQNNNGRKRKLENSCDASNRLDIRITQFSDCNPSKRTKKENCVEPVLSSDSGLSVYLYKNTKFNNEVVQSSNCDSSKNTNKQNCIAKFNNKVIQSSNCDSSKSTKKQNCTAPSLSLDSHLSKYLYRSKMEHIREQKNYKQSFHPSFLSENIVNKKVAGKSILCSNNIDKDSKCQKRPCTMLTKLDEHEVHSSSHKFAHNVEEKTADCRNNFEQTTKSVSEENAKMTSQNSDGSILSCSLKVSVHNLNNVCDNNCKEIVETNIETSSEKNSDISLDFASCEKQLVISQFDNTSHLPKNTCSIDTVCDNNSASLETRTKNPIVSTEDESNSSNKVPPQWDIIQSAIEKYGCDYILSKINHYLNC